MGTHVRNPHRLVPVTVTGVERPAEELVRVTLHAPEFRDTPGFAPDEYFGLVMPQEGQRFKPFRMGHNPRASVSFIPRSERPTLRWYTVRHYRPADAEVDVDVVTHGDNGPGSAWFNRVRPGDTAGFLGCHPVWEPAQGRLLIVADPSSLPAARRMLSHLEATDPASLGTTEVVVVGADEGMVEPGFADYWAPLVARLHVTRTPSAASADEIARLFTVEGWDMPDTVWACGEGGMAKKVRNLAVKTWGVNSKAITWVPYWFEGRPRP